MAEYEKYRYGRGVEEEPKHAGPVAYESAEPGNARGYDFEHDVFGDEKGNAIKYKTMSWWMVAVLMIAEIVSNGMLSLPAAMAVVGIVPATILIIFLGVFATFTAWTLIQFKLRHPQVHNMGDAGLILFGPIGREVLAGGTVIMAVFFTGSQLLAGQIALSALSNNALCTMAFAGIFAGATLVLSFPCVNGTAAFITAPQN